MDLKLFFASTFGKLSFPLFVSSLFSLIITIVIDIDSSLLNFVLKAFLFAIFYFVIIYKYGMNEFEKSLIPINKKMFTFNSK